MLRIGTHPTRTFARKVPWALPFLLIVPFLAQGRPAADPWSRLWEQCHDVHTYAFEDRLSAFQKLISLGKSWQRYVTLNKTAIDDVTDKTCKAWAASPNGDTYLKEFIAKYGAASGMAVSLEDEANNYLLDRLGEWDRVNSAEVSRLRSYPGGRRLRWETNFPCSGAFSFAMTHIRAEVQALQGKLERLGKECPRGADNLTQAARTRSLGPRVGGGTAPPRPAPVPERKVRHAESDITGTERKPASLK